MKQKIFKTEKSLYFTIGLLSAALAIIAYFYIANNYNKYDFVKIKEFNEGENFNVISYYDDLDNDGVSERIPVGYSDAQKNYFIQIYNLKGDVLEQFNFHRKRIFHFKYNHKTWISFDDWDNDGVKEIYCASMENDTLFLNIISAKKLNFILKDRPIYVRRNIRKDLHWSVSDVSAKTLDVNNDGIKDLFLSFETGFALQPRGFMTYDIKNDVIIDTFFTNVTAREFTITDIDKDGEYEIILAAVGSGQYPADAKFTDQKKWLFVLNKDLNFKFNPRSYGRFGSQIAYAVVNSEIRVFVLNVNKNMDAVYERISNKGEVIERKIFKNFGSGKVVRFTNENGKDFYSVTITNKGTFLYSSDKLLGQENNEMLLRFTGDLTRDGIKELVFSSYDGFIVADQSLNKIAEFRLKKPSVIPQLVQMGKEKGNAIAIQTADKNTIYQLQASFVYKYAMLLVVLIFGILFLFFSLIHFTLKQISLFYKSFLFFINENNSCLLLLNSSGKILRYNKQFANSLGIKSNARKKHFSEILSNYKNIEEKIKTALSGQKTIQSELSFYKGGKLLKGKIEIMPYKAFLGYTYAYLIKIIDQTEEIINERLQVWSHTAQKIAHEIKTPLGSIQLNLKALLKRLKKENISNPEINDDIDLINNEIDRIKKLTSSLLKITNLEKPNVKPYNLLDLINDSLQKFRGYFNGKIKINISEELKDKFIFFDKNQFIEVIQIIVENSIDALKGEGVINFYIENIDDKFLTLVIEDNGVGIKPENQEKIFEPYYTTKREGTGLGLAFAKKIVEDNLGTIIISSIRGKGTIVKIKLRINNEL